MRLFSNQGGFILYQAVYDFPDGPDVFSYINHFLLEAVDDLHGAGRGGIHEFRFKIFNFIPQCLQDDKIMIHNGIDEGIGQIVAPWFPNPGLRFPDSLPDEIENISRNLLESYQEIRPQNQAELFGTNFFGCLVIIEHFQDNEKQIFEFFGLRPLTGI